MLSSSRTQPKPLHLDFFPTDSQFHSRFLPSLPPTQMVAARLRLALLLSVCLCSAWARPRLEQAIRLPSQRAAAADETDDGAVGTRWAVLIAGSSGYYNYRHQVRGGPVPLRSPP